MSVRRITLIALATLAAVQAERPLRAQTAVTLSAAASPSAAQPGIHSVIVTGAGFPTGTISAADVIVTVQAASGLGPSGSTAATAIATVVGSTRRVTFQIPTTISVASPTAYFVSLTGRTSTGVTFASANKANLTVNPPASIVAISPNSVQAGATTAIAIATQFTNFVQGATQATFGPGVSVGGAADGALGFVTVTSPTTATAQVVVGANASGLRDVRVQTGVQIATRASGLTVVAPNGSPVITSDPATAGSERRSYSYQVLASDPDGDSLSFALVEAPDGMQISPAGLITWVPAAGQIGSQAVSVRVTDGKGGAASQQFSVSVSANHSPAITSQPTLNGAESQPYGYQITAIDPDGDPLTISLTQFPSGMTVTAAGAVSWTPAAAQVGAQAVAIEVADDRGGVARQSFNVTVGAAASVIQIDVTPEVMRFSALGTERPLVVTGRLSDGTTVDLTASPDTTYESSNRFVSSVDASGVARSVANGSATITVRHRGFIDSTAAIVEVGVTLDSIELAPATTTLRTAGASVDLSVQGRFSNGDIRDLTAADGTVFETANGGVASVTGAGHVTATGNGDASITARHDAISAQATVHVAISEGSGFFRGEVFDDSRGLPLTGAIASLIVDGNGPLTTPVSTSAEDRGRYAVTAKSGEAVVRVTRPGFTMVERAAVVPAGAGVTALDARLTPIDSRSNAVPSAFGGTAHDSAGTTTLVVQPGSRTGNADLRLTPIGAQGLQNRLPYGWSPVGAVDIAPPNEAFAQPAVLTLPITAGLAPGSELVVVAYNSQQHAWIVTGIAHVATDGRSVQTSIGATGQIACVAADQSPFVPPTATVGGVLAGVAAIALSEDVTASGDVIPRSAPPGDQARAVGRILIQHGTALPSGSVVRARVTERFDLADQSQVVPQPFTEDVVLYSRGRPAGAGILGASFPIAPSKDYSILELARGVIAIQIAVTADDPAGHIVGTGSSTIEDGAGDRLDIPAGALGSDVIADLRRLDSGSLSVAAPAGFDLLGSLVIDLVGTTLALPARLSIAAPASVTPLDQILVAKVFADAAGTFRLRLVGVAALDNGRLVSQTALGSFNFEGPRSEGQYVFLRAHDALGFITGRVLGPDGSTPRALSLVTVDTVPFADAAQANGGFVVAGKAGFDTLVRALDFPTRDTATSVVRANGRDEIVSRDVILTIIVPTVTTTNPVANAINVPLNTSITVDFSAAIDPASISDSTIVVQFGGAVSSGTRTLSSDRRRLVFRPDAPLQGKTAYTMTLTGVRSSTGRALAGFGSLTFTTVDPSKSTLTDLGLITAALPNEDGEVLVDGGAGVAEGNSPVTGTNLRSQQTITLLANHDGSFRLRLPASIADEIAVTLRDGSGRETTVRLSQFRSPDGTTSVGEGGGTIAGSHGRIGTILPRSLVQAGIFQIADAPATTVWPPLPDDFSYVDQFHYVGDAAQFNRIDSIGLTESLSRFAPETSSAPPFTAHGTLTVPADFLINGSLRFSASALDASGARRTATDATVVVASSPDEAEAENGQTADFPTVFISAPKQSTQNRLVSVDAVAPAARVDLELPAPSGSTAASFLLVRRAEIDGVVKLSVVDTLVRTVRGGNAILRTSGRELPGMSTTADYAVVAARDPLVFISGRAAGPAAMAALDGSPFVSETLAPNGGFALPSFGGRPFSIRFSDAVTGSALGSSSGQAPATGALNIGQALPPTTSRLVLTVEPQADAVVDINQALVVHFSEPVDARSAGSAIVVTDSAGVRVLGAATVSSDGLTATFTPLRRWQFGTTFRWGVATTLVGLSGSQLAQNANGTFTTFAPRVLGTSAAGVAHDVAIAGALAVVATDTGLASVDISSATSPAIRSQVSIAGGARGAALRSNATFTDRNGLAHTGTIAAIASGNETGIGRLDLFDLSNTATPALIGSVQLTSAPGQAAPPDVPASTGTPNAVAITTDLRAFTAVQGLGIESVRIADAVPPDAGSPGRGLDKRYPTTGSENVNHAAVLGDRVLIAGAAGLTSLDAASLTRRGRVSTTGNATAVAALPAFSIDLNGDHTIDASEVFDLAVVANGADGTLQFYRVPPTGDPTLLSVVHFPGETTSVALDATERLAYIGLGARGIGIVDLDGPASVQPIDVDRNGVDDRILGVLDTPGTAERVALALNRGIGLVADGPAGITTLQLLPPRTTFQTLLRDPIKSRSGDEQSILESRQAFTTDQALSVTIEAVTAEQALSLVIDETPGAGGARLLSFENGATSVPLTPGLNTVAINVANTVGDPGSVAKLKVIASNGALIAAVDFRLVPPPANGTLQTLLVSPETTVIPADRNTQQLSVVGLFSDGRAQNLTANSGTLYRAVDAAVVTVDADGLVTAVAGGTTSIFVSNGATSAVAEVRVDHAPALVTFEVPRTHMTLTSTAGRSIGVQGRLSDGTLLGTANGLRPTFTSSDTSIAEISADGTITAKRDGVVTITVGSGSVQKQVEVAVEFRAPTVLVGIALAPLTAVTTDVGELLPKATVTGSGTLDAVPISFSVTGIVKPPVTVKTNVQGIAIAQFKGISTPTTLTITASAVNPADGSTLVASQNVTILPGTEDHEPNDDPAAASSLAFGRTASGSIGGADSRDFYRLTSTTDGIVTATLTVSSATIPNGLALVFGSESGADVQRVPVTAAITTASQTIQAGVAFVRVETTSAPVSYGLSAKFAQSPVVIQGVSPANGGPGTVVTIDGSGFSTEIRQDMVFFGEAVAKIVSATATRLEAVVPANAVDGALQVVVRNRQTHGPGFVTGNSGPLPAPILQRSAITPVREHPALGAIVDLQRLMARFDPSATRSQVDQVAASLGGTVASVLPDFNEYSLEFEQVQTLRQLDGIKMQLAANPLVEQSIYSIHTQRRQGPQSYDSRDRGLTITGQTGSQVSAGIAYELAKIFDALTAIRTTPPFDGHLAPGTLTPTTVAVIDSGFNPGQTFLASEFTDSNGHVVVQHIPAVAGAATTNPSNGQLQPQAPFDSETHGTRVTSIIAALNGGHPGVTGGLNGLFRADETAFDVLSYRDSIDATGGIPDATKAAFNDIKRRGNVNVVNLSWGNTFYTLADAAISNDWYRPHFGAMPNTLFVVASGENGTDNLYDTPSSLSVDFDNVLGVGAVQVSIDTDRRADFGSFTDEIQAIFYQGDPCDLHDYDQLGSVKILFQLSRASNCGSIVNFAAPGIEVLADDPSGRFSSFSGTSAAAPLTSAVAGLVHAISRGLLDANDIRQVLVDTGDEIATTWNDGINPTLASPSVKRLNALAAVRKILPPPESEATYIADRNANVIVAIELDPMSGQERGLVHDKEIAMHFTSGGVTFEGRDPVSMVMSPAGELLYVLAECSSPQEVGDGILLINTASQQPVAFIPLSGAAFPPVTGADPVSPVRVQRPRAPMVISNDGRLLYVATGTGIRIVNVAEGKMVQSYFDLPAPYKLRAATRPVDEFTNRLQAIRNAVIDGITNPARQGTNISALALSPNGKALYAAFQTGAGGASGTSDGNQPGGVVPINVDLYTDASPNVFGLQTDLSHFLELLAPTLEMFDAGSVGRGDEPTAITVGPDNRHVYMFNGGLSRVEGIAPDALGIAHRFDELIGGAGFGLAASTQFSGGIEGTMNAVNAFSNSSGPRAQQMLGELKLLSDSGVGLMVAPGYTAVFDMNGSGSHQWLFPSEVITGWNVGGDGTSITTDADSGLMVTQFTFPEVFAKRPFAVAMKPRGPALDASQDFQPENRRAIVAFGASGNFGVLDLDAQKKFSDVTPPNPAMINLPNDIFKAWVGVTPAVPLGTHTWPSRGVIPTHPGVNEIVPSPDENFLFTSDIKYAQNGRFAVAAHQGRETPHDVPAEVPDFVNNIAEREALLALGFSYSGGSQIEAPDGTNLSVGTPLTFKRGGGAFSVINDAAISRDFAQHLTQLVTDDDGATVPYFARIPICDVVEVDPGTNDPRPNCSTEAVIRHSSYLPASGTKRFVAPRAVAIQPFAMIETPRTGDHITLNTAIALKWRDEQVSGMRVSVYNLQSLVDGQPVSVSSDDVNLTPDQKQTRFLTAEFGGLFPPNNGPIAGTLYRIEIQLFNGPTNNAEREFSRTSVDVVFEDPSGPVPVTRLDLSPTIIPLAAPAGSSQLAVKLRSNNSPSQDVTGEAHYEWIGGATNGGTPLPADFAAGIVASIRAKLDATADAPPVAFDVIPNGLFSINPQGSATSLVPGIQVVRAHFDDINTRPSVVLSGFTVDRVELEPVGAEAVFENGSIGSQIINSLGRHMNAPLVIAPTDSNFIDDDGRIELGEVFLRYSGGGTITLNDLMDILRQGGAASIEQDYQDAISHNPAPIGSTPAWRHAQALVSLMEPAVPGPSSSLSFATSNASTAFVLDGGGAFNGRVASNGAGLAIVTGTVDFGAFGTGTDGVLVWSLGPLESATIKPSVTQIRRTDPPTPGPTIRTVVATTKQSVVIPVPAGFTGPQTAATEIMPKDIVRSGVFTLDDELGVDYKVRLRGGGIAQSSGFQFNDFTLSFEVPTDEAPEVKNLYTVADPTVVRTGSQEKFTEHLVHQNHDGATTVDAAVHIDGLGDVHATGDTVVCDCSGPVVVTRLGGPAIVQAGDRVQYEIRALNPTTAPLAGVVVSVQFLLGGTSLATQTLNIGTIAEDSAVSLPLEVTAPFAGTLRTVVIAPGFTAIQAPDVSVQSASGGGVIITEMVLDPKSDWSDSSGGNGVPFDATPGNGVIDGNDVWIEISSGTTGTETWVVELRDATGATFTKPLGPPTTSSQTRLLTGFGVGSSPIERVQIIDNNGLVRQTLDIQAINAILGPATSPSDESLTWSFFGSPTAVLQQFVRRNATVNQFLPF